mmetsp:Transcript_7368/g.10983  ORF Transcript_7368/g.10983 Transcript_7368/m.10983 type:complete len:623 (-) Transcript_7368:207-2075(-)
MLEQKYSNKIEDGPDAYQYEGKSNDRENKSWFNHISYALVAGFLILFATLSISSKSFKNIKSSNGLATTTVSDEITTDVITPSINSKPNFIFILADDLGYNSVGYNAHDLTAVTPFLTSLAKGGVVLSNYYAQEVCTPSRASLLTGRYPVSLGMQYEEILSDSMWGLNTSETLLPEVLRDMSAYKSYAIGKWNIGHYTPEMLPTARGFDHFIGYMNGENYYWSKKYPLEPQYTDFMYADSDCYSAYNSSDLGTYSTFLYRDKAVQAIAAHDFSANPLFMYLAVQAVHDPFDDLADEFSNGIPASYLEASMYSHILSTVKGRSRQQYAMALNLLDSSVQTVVEALAAKGQMQNTYVIFASDNGGCYQAGGRNGDLRGSKGSLFEGGLKVDSFIYSALLPDSARGSVYSGIMHVSDWFPTILELSGSDYIPQAGFDLDGVSQVTAMLAADATQNARQYLLYNMYYKVNDESFDIYSNAPVAIRDKQYKLAHLYVDNPQAQWYSFEEALSDDSNMGSFSCPQSMALMGRYAKFLFDLDSDPNEKTNLYFNSQYSDIKSELYRQLEYFRAKVSFDAAPANVSVAAEAAWADQGDVIMPWVVSALPSGGTSKLSQCVPSQSVFAWAG